MGHREMGNLYAWVIEKWGIYMRGNGLYVGIICGARGS